MYNAKEYACLTALTAYSLLPLLPALLLHSSSVALLATMGLAAGLAKNYSQSKRVKGSLEFRPLNQHHRVCRASTAARGDAGGC